MRYPSACLVVIGFVASIVLADVSCSTVDYKSTQANCSGVLYDLSVIAPGGGAKW